MTWICDNSVSNPSSSMLNQKSKVYHLNCERESNVASGTRFGSKFLLFFFFL